MVTSPRQDHHGRDAADASTVAPRTLAYRRGHSRMRQEPSDDEEMYAYDTVMLPEDQTDEGKPFTFLSFLYEHCSNVLRILWFINHKKLKSEVLWKW